MASITAKMILHGEMQTLIDFMNNTECPDTSEFQFHMFNPSHFYRADYEEMRWSAGDYQVVFPVLDTLVRNEIVRVSGFEYFWTENGEQRIRYSYSLIRRK